MKQSSGLEAVVSDWQQFKNYPSLRKAFEGKFTQHFETKTGATAKEARNEADNAWTSTAQRLGPHKSNWKETPVNLDAWTESALQGRTATASATKRVVVQEADAGAAAKADDGASPAAASDENAATEESEEFHDAQSVASADFRDCTEADNDRAAPGLEAGFTGFLKAKKLQSPKTSRHSERTRKAAKTRRARRTDRSAKEAQVAFTLGDDGDIHDASETQEWADYCKAQGELTEPALLMMSTVTLRKATNGPDAAEWRNAIDNSV